MLIEMASESVAVIVTGAALWRRDRLSYRSMGVALLWCLSVALLSICFGRIDRLAVASDVRQRFSQDAQSAYIAGLHAAQDFAGRYVLVGLVFSVCLGVLAWWPPRLPDRS